MITGYWVLQMVYVAAKLRLARERRLLVVSRRL
jgi:hypothetical protein